MGWFGSGGRFVELSQQGCAIVMVVPEMPPTGQRASVHGPRPYQVPQRPSPPVYTNSTPDGSCQVDITGDAAVYPVAVALSATGTGPRARCARTPLTYSCRVSVSRAGAAADHSPFAGSASDQPVTRTAPLATGCVPVAAVQVIPESRPSRVSGEVSR